ncbi:hypothetical protein [Nocardia terrae]|uniref:hypothetical protein n=1 Tax=Nocardia terrae TaxID=2675851 RepID=UPI002E253B00
MQVGLDQPGNDDPSGTVDLVETPAVQSRPDGGDDAVVDRDVDQFRVIGDTSRPQHQIHRIRHGYLPETK